MKAEGNLNSLFLLTSERNFDDYFSLEEKVITQNEKRFFDLLTKDYMTDESYGSGDEIFLHKRVRRSKSKDAQTCRTDDIMNPVYVVK